MKISTYVRTRAEYNVESSLVSITEHALEEQYYEYTYLVQYTLIYVGEAVGECNNGRQSYGNVYL